LTLEKENVELVGTTEGICAGMAHLNARLPTNDNLIRQRAT